MTSPDRQPTDPDVTDVEALQRALSAALQESDPVPAHVVDAARGAFAWRTIDEELADLVFDSATELTGVRDLAGPRQLTFRAPGIEIEVMVVDPSTRRIVGQLVPGQATTVCLEGTGDRLAQDSDRFGRFSFDAVREDPVRLSVESTDGTKVTTDWVLL